MDQENQSQQGSAPQGAPATPAAAPMDAKQKNTLVAILSYIGILVVVAYLLGKDEPFAKFHIKQGLVLFALELVVMVVSYSMPFFYMFSSILNLAFIALSIVGIVYVIQGKEKELPLIGGLSKHVPI